MSSVKKRKADGSGSLCGSKRSKASPPGDPLAHWIEKDKVQRLAKEIEESPKYYNNIVALLELAQEELETDLTRRKAVKALHDVFLKLSVGGKLNTSKSSTDSEKTVTKWLREQCLTFAKMFLQYTLQKSSIKDAQDAVSFYLVILKEDVRRAPSTSKESSWSTRIFSRLMDVVMHEDLQSTELRKQHLVHFAQSFCGRYKDIRHHTFLHIARSLTSRPSKITQENCYSILVSLPSFSSLEGEESDLLWCDTADVGPQSSSITPKTHRKAAQSAWICLLTSALTHPQRKKLLELMASRILPWFANRTERLADFLTDSFNEGGSTSLLALQGIFHLMREKNLDYPSFYTKLYSLLDANVLHSRHRSRFFRSLNTFLSSTHLPATLVASFIKRLSRLSLHAPPAGIVAVLPWVYNMLKRHPACTFLVHRAPRNVEQFDLWEKQGFDDPFDASEPEPTKTGAIDSTLWELKTLQSHYHPNVASLCRIISEQFTKEKYDLEDFLDHSYTGLIEMELGKELRKPPVVEFEIPKKIYTDAQGGTLLRDIMLDFAQSREL